jgi:hypothetical protein
MGNEPQVHTKYIISGVLSIVSDSAVEHVMIAAFDSFNAIHFQRHTKVWNDQWK